MSRARALRKARAEGKLRYDDETWGEFEAGAKRSRLDDGRTVWQWMNGKRASKGGKKEKSPGLLDVKTDLTPPPRKSPVSDAITLPSDEREAQVVKNVLAAIDTVHDDGKLQKFRVEFDPIEIVNANAWFDNDWRVMSVASDGLEPHLSIAHEIGHQIDYHLFGNGKHAGTETMHLLKPEVREWWDEVQSTETFKNLSGPGLIASKNQRTYLTNPVECWARAYSQFIAHESGDRILGKEIADLQAGEQYYTQLVQRRL